MTESLLERSARYIDGAVYEGPRTVNPIDGSFHEVAEGVGLVCGFSHIWTVDADQGLVVLDDTASALEGLVSDTLAMMNAGARLDEIVHTVRVPTELLERPYLRPSYDEPEFVVRNIWRLYGGWHDGNPARLKPAPDSAVAAEVSAMAGGAGALARRAQELCEAGDLRLACQLVEWAAQAAPADAEVHATRAEVYRVRRDRELSLMARGLYLDASRSSEVVSQPLQAPD